MEFLQQQFGIIDKHSRSGDTIGEIRIIAQQPKEATFIASQQNRGFFMESTMDFRFLRQPEMRHLLGNISRSALEDLIVQGRIPKPYKLGKRIVAWRSDEVSEALAAMKKIEDAYVASRKTKPSAALPAVSKPAPKLEKPANSLETAKPSVVDAPKLALDDDVPVPRMTRHNPPKRLSVIVEELHPRDRKPRFS